MLENDKIEGLEKLFQTQKLKNLNKELYSLLDKVKKVRMTTPCLLEFLFDYEKMDIILCITHIKHDSRVVDIPAAYKKFYNADIPEEDANVLYSMDEKRLVKNLYVSPNFLFSTKEIDFTRFKTRYKKSKPFILFPRTTYTHMKMCDKILFDSLNLKINNQKDELEVSFETSSNFVLNEYLDEFDEYMVSKLLPLDKGTANSDIVRLLKEYDEKKLVVTPTEEMMENKVIYLPFGSFDGTQDTDRFTEAVEVFYDFVLGKVKEIKYHQNLDKIENSECICEAVVCMIYNGWCSYFIYKYVKIDI